MAAAWCGALGTDAVIGQGWLRTVSPCWVESGAAAALLLLCAALAVIQNTSSKSWQANQQAQGVVFKPGMLGREVSFMIASSILLVIHLSYALASAVVLPGLPYHTAHHAGLALIWLILVSSQLRRQVACSSTGSPCSSRVGYATQTCMLSRDACPQHLTSRRC